MFTQEQSYKCLINIILFLFVVVIAVVVAVVSVKIKNSFELVKQQKIIIKHELQSFVHVCVRESRVCKK